MNETAIRLVIDLAKDIIGKTQTTFPGMDEVYVRLDAPDDLLYGTIHEENQKPAIPQQARPSASITDM
ncbi:hypothetical protein [Achromobacter xylosoxidans]|uniref:hypothetical protein n=1 Tax=Alcaligenes xylosoxydans xylosoxydans TaxID=85698 RepID=UPI001EEAEBCC|nr:hypothetical protein [Achromobacter xylosoxidans]